jgi:AraC-like DNA-binding protein
VVDNGKGQVGFAAFRQTGVCSITMRHLAVRPRSPALWPFIAAFHYNETELPFAVERILPTGQAHLLVNLHEDEFRTYNGPDCKTVQATCGAIFAGPHGRSTGLDTKEQRQLIAVEFKHAGAASFFPMPLMDVCDQVIGLDLVWGRDGRLLRERLCEKLTASEKFALLEAKLLERLKSDLDPAIAAAVKFLEHGVSVLATASRVGLLPKTFGRHFCHQVGLNPKRFWRVRRMQRVIASVQRPARLDWCAIAAKYGYADQAHLIHDFRDLTGITPSAYRPSSPERRNHVAVVSAGS